MELRLVSIDTSLLPIGLLMVHLATGTKFNSPIPAHTVESIGPAAIQDYRLQCDMSCYACKLCAESVKIDSYPPSSSCGTL